jgi:hypothetical protein
VTAALGRPKGAHAAVRRDLDQGADVGPAVAAVRVGVDGASEAVGEAIGGHECVRDPAVSSLAKRTVESGVGNQASESVFAGPVDPPEVGLDDRAAGSGGEGTWTRPLLPRLETAVPRADRPPSQSPSTTGQPRSPSGTSRWRWAQSSRERSSLSSRSKHSWSRNSGYA